MCWSECFDLCWRIYHCRFDNWCGYFSNNDRCRNYHWCHRYYWIVSPICATADFLFAISHRCTLERARRPALPLPLPPAAPRRCASPTSALRASSAPSLQLLLLKRVKELTGVVLGKVDHCGWICRQDCFLSSFSTPLIFGQMISNPLSSFHKHGDSSSPFLISASLHPLPYLLALLRSALLTVPFPTHLSDIF